MNELCKPIARTGEPIYVSIIRNRSGMDVGDIDFGLRVGAVEKLSDRDKKDIVDVAYLLYEGVCNAAEKRSKLERR